ncbi:hypothetical protein OH76DRAFT_64728 [Lentinus brumalis]|uniref:Uncharacterized protein n=1 Tax=Lentinus brumalis TaxID=2498619 RepID=A0A371DKI7_9APHY|nr:hypothetical protein OH76DRAFT_64728 [Polyporus brumalis]
MLFTPSEASVARQRVETNCWKLASFGTDGYEAKVLPSSLSIGKTVYSVCTNHCGLSPNKPPIQLTTKHRPPNVLDIRLYRPHNRIHVTVGRPRPGRVRESREGATCAQGMPTRRLRETIRGMQVQGPRSPPACTVNFTLASCVPATTVASLGGYTGVRRVAIGRDMGCATLQK